ncbi:hypothetical protein MCETE7_00285 [Acidimicrobiia bacterium]
MVVHIQVWAWRRVGIPNLTLRLTFTVVDCGAEPGCLLRFSTFVVGFLVRTHGIGRFGPRRSKPMNEVDMSSLPSVSPRVRNRRGTVGVLLALAILCASALPSTAAPIRSANADGAAAWMAEQVAPDGSVLNPYSLDPSVDWALNVALGLAAVGTQPDALGRAMSYIESNVSNYVTGGSSDVAGRNAWLVILAYATGRDPRSFGMPATDLVAGILARYEVSESGLFGATGDEYTPVTTHALSVIALTAAGETVPIDAVTWLEEQQCPAGNSAAGAWEGYRARVVGVLVACGESSVGDFESAESGSTSLAIQALVAAGETGSVAAALEWLSGLQSFSGTAPGGFGQFIGDSSDPNSTALVVQAISAAGGDPDASPWRINEESPMTSLAHWVIQSGPGAGALASPYSSGEADIYATYQAVWGLTSTVFPFVEPLPVTTTASLDPVIDVTTPSFTG